MRAVRGVGGEDQLRQDLLGCPARDVPDRRRAARSRRCSPRCRPRRTTTSCWPRSRTCAARRRRDDRPPRRPRSRSREALAVAEGVEVAVLRRPLRRRARRRRRPPPAGAPSRRRVAPRAPRSRPGCRGAPRCPRDRPGPRPSRRRRAPSRPPRACGAARKKYSHADTRYGSPTVAPIARTVVAGSTATAARVTAGSGRKTHAPAGASTSSPPIVKRACPATTTYSSSWCPEPVPRSSCSSTTRSPAARAV